jgi:hypothetical protein
MYEIGLDASSRWPPDGRRAKPGPLSGVKDIVRICLLMTQSGHAPAVWASAFDCSASLVACAASSFACFRYASVSASLRCAIDSDALAFIASTFACWSSFAVEPACVEDSLAGGAGCEATEGEATEGEATEGEATVGPGVAGALNEAAPEDLEARTRRVPPTAP